MEWDLDKYLDQDGKPNAEKHSAPAPTSQRQCVPKQRPEPQTARRTADAGAHARRRVGSLPPWVMVLVSMLCYSFLFHVFSEAVFEDGFSFGRFLSLLLFSLAFAVLAALVGTIGKRRKTQTICAMVIVILWAILFLMEYFILDSFKNFYTLEGIFTGAGNAGLRPDFLKYLENSPVRTSHHRLVSCQPLSAPAADSDAGCAPLSCRRRYCAFSGCLILRSCPFAG